MPLRVSASLQPVNSVKSHLYRCHAGLRRKREDTRVVRPHPDRRKPGTNLGQGWVGPDTSVWMHRTPGESTDDASVRSDQFRCARPAGNALAAQKKLRACASKEWVTCVQEKISCQQEKISCQLQAAGNKLQHVRIPFKVGWLH
jgi:hypothetical protein